MKIEYVERLDKWLVIGQIRDTSLMLDIPGKRATKSTGDFEVRWYVPATLQAARALHVDTGAEWTPDAAAQLACLKDDRRTRIEKNSFEFDDDRLSPLQRVGVSHLIGGNTLQSDDQGTGKTVQSCVALEARGDERVLLLTTTSTIYSWRDHIAEWAPSYKTFIFVGTKAKRIKMYKDFCAYEGKKVLIGTHAAPRTHSAQASFGNVPRSGEEGELNSHWDLLIVDEIHRALGLKQKAVTNRAYVEVRKTVDTCWGLTGTPVNDNADDAQNIMNIIDPSVFFHRSDFRKRYCIMKVEFHGGITNQGLNPFRKAEYNWIMKEFLIRRLKQEVLTDLPLALPTETVHLDLLPTQRSIYNQLAKKRVAKVGGNMLIVPEHLQQNNLFEYLADGTPVVDEDGNITAIDGPSSKLDYIMEKARNRKGDPFVVYNHSTRVLDMVQRAMVKEGFKVGYIEGSLNARERADYVNAFQQGLFDVMLVSDAGAEGLTLTAADLLIYMRHSWRKITNDQAGDRIYRATQKRPAQRVILVCDGTVDVTREKSLVGKAQRVEDVVGDAAREEAWLMGLED